LNMIMTPAFGRIGLGAVRPYVASNDGKGFTHTYGQTILGFGLPVYKNITLEVLAFYLFDEWKNFRDFNLDRAEWRIWLSIPY